MHIIGKLYDDLTGDLTEGDRRLNWQSLIMIFLSCTILRMNYHLKNTIIRIKQCNKVQKPRKDQKNSRILHKEHQI